MRLQLQLLVIVAIFCFCGSTEVNERPFANDQCPDTFERPLDYRNIVQFAVVNSTAHQHQPCVVITQCSIDRLNHLEKLTRAWGGAVSAAVYVATTSAAEQAESLKTIETFATKLTEDSTYTGLLYLSVLFGHEDSPWRYDCPKTPPPHFPLYPINNLRNLAVIGSGGPRGSPYPLFFLLDADFAPSMGLRAWIRTHAHAGLIERCRKGDIIVIPAFETILPASNPTLPFLLAGIADGKVEQFHGKRYDPGHGPSNYSM